MVIRNRNIDIQSKVKLFQRKLKTGFPLLDFYKNGNGHKTILNKTGRLTDFKGLFVISNRKSKALILGESTHVLKDVQKLVRGERVQDREVLEQLASCYGFSTSLAGQVYLKSMRINWIEVADKVERIALKRALRPTIYLTI